MRRATTGTWRWHTPSAIACSIVTSQRWKRWLTHRSADKVVAYLSAEFLTGPHLGNSLINLGIWEAVEQALSQLGQDLTSLLEQEEEPGLGNGGLGRLAACYMDSLATLNVPAIGYGIRYEFGIFDQAIRDGWQVELTDKWLRFGNPWEIVRSDVAFDVKFGGRTEHYRDAAGPLPRALGARAQVVKGIAYDTPVPGYRRADHQPAAPVESRGRRVVRLRRPSTSATTTARCEQKVASETISKVLYPNDEPEAGKQLRLHAAVLLRVLLAPGHDPAASRCAARACTSSIRTGPRS